MTRIRQTDDRYREGNAAFNLGNVPISFALAARGLLYSVTNFLASSRISMTLFKRAKSGAKGKEATNTVTMANWITVEKIIQTIK